MALLPADLAPPRAEQCAGCGGIPRGIALDEPEAGGRLRIAAPNTRCACATGLASVELRLLDTVVAQQARRPAEGFERGSEESRRLEHEPQ